ncbi:MAG TPA: hypothetical protein VMT34_15070, partial [Aggregatilineales bacterium]|nr:hypothetical protein [Aggregatilineales bacterium]
MDESARYNAKRWKALAEANALFTRPRLELDAKTAQEMIDPDGKLGDLRGKRVLCLAGGGGQQSACYALLEAEVTNRLPRKRSGGNRGWGKRYEL